MISHESQGLLDVHVHLVGNGRQGSGCWMKMNLYRRMFGEVMLRAIRFRADLTDEDFDRRFAAFLAEQVADSQLSHAVVLAYDHAYDPDGHMLRAGTFYVPNSWALEVARSHAGLLPGVSIHPAREDALRELERCIEAGAVLLKMLPPSHNIDCALPRYREFFKMMADAGLPLLAHTGGEYTVPVLDRRLCDPQTLRQPLDLGVKVIAAHMATRSAPPLLERDYFPVLTEMMREYPHLYGDNSALNSPNRSHGLRGSLREDVVDRVVHGSDYPVPVSGRWALLRRLVSREQLKHAHVSKNPLERDLRLKQSMGFGPEVFTRAWRILRVPGT